MGPQTARLRDGYALACFLIGFMLCKAEPLAFKISEEFDTFNQGTAVEYFEAKFYSDPSQWSLNDTYMAEAELLGRIAREQPVLALAAAQVLFMFGWFRPDGTIIRPNIVSSAELYQVSIDFAGCKELSSEDWVNSACDVRWTFPTMLYNWLAETEEQEQQRLAYQEKAEVLLHGLKKHPRYAQVSQHWQSPKQINFNALRFPEAPSKPFWDSKIVPLARFLEEHHATFKAELKAIIDDPRGIYEQLRLADGSRECLATPGGWETVRIVRYGYWYDLFCELAPETCRLLASRPEISNCSFVNANYQKLNPNSHLKPHYGNSPRLAAHLPVIAPEPLKASMTVGDQQELWVEGRVIVFDDTYAHAVSHWGSDPRYVLNVWFCHPCDENNAHMQTCPEKD